MKKNLLTAILDQPTQSKGWRQEEEVVNFFHAKSLIQSLCASFSCTQNIRWELCDEKNLPFLHPGASAYCFLNNIRIGYAGELHPKSSLAFSLGGDTPILLEIDLDSLYQAIQEGIKIETTSKKYPPVSRDLALLVPEDLNYELVESCFWKNPKKKNLNALRLFDLYQGENIPTGKKEYGL